MSTLFFFLTECYPIEYAIEYATEYATEYAIVYAIVYGIEQKLSVLQNDRKRHPNTLHQTLTQNGQTTRKRSGRSKAQHECLPSVPKRHAGRVQEREPRDDLRPAGQVHLGDVFRAPPRRKGDLGPARGSRQGPVPARTRQLRRTPGIRPEGRRHRLVPAEIRPQGQARKGPQRPQAQHERLSPLPERHARTVQARKPGHDLWAARQVHLAHVQEPDPRGKGHLGGTGRPGQGPVRRRDRRLPATAGTRRPRRPHRGTPTPQAQQARPQGPRGSQAGLGCLRLFHELHAPEGQRGISRNQVCRARKAPRRALEGPYPRPEENLREHGRRGQDPLPGRDAAVHGQPGGGGGAPSAPGSGIDGGGGPRGPRGRPVLRPGGGPRGPAPPSPRIQHPPGLPPRSLRPPTVPRGLGVSDRTSCRTAPLTCRFGSVFVIYGWNRMKTNQNRSQQ
mmetsp:Transcript_16121/g.33373  ORF Transcript_16121/g.33373 Transcript_16121/m.33373 type:complete len:448 (+) Transcript_16121:431-1774(+)